MLSQSVTHSSCSHLLVRPVKLTLGELVELPTRALSIAQRPRREPERAVQAVEALLHQEFALLVCALIQRPQCTAEAIAAVVLVDAVVGRVLDQRLAAALPHGGAQRQATHGERIGRGELLAVRSVQLVRRLAVRPITVTQWLCATVLLALELGGAAMDHTHTHTRTGMGDEEVNERVAAG